MPALNSITAFHDDMTVWRQDFHAHPELLFDLPRTAQTVADKLRGWGIEVHEGLAQTGVVGVIRGRSTASGRSIGLRADMDALPMQEANTFAHASQTPGHMHACGHDGHTAMLLGAARHLAENPDFDGTVVLIFQPAEEGGGGARVMIEDGLFERFPCDSVWGLHNWPELPVGMAGVHYGASMASQDRFDITLHGKGGHAAMPHLCRDPVVGGAQIVTALQTLVSRTLNPVDAGVVSVTIFQAGEADNVIASSAKLAGTVRAFKPEVRQRLEDDLHRVVNGIAATMGLTADILYKRGYPPTVNDATMAKIAATVAEDVLGQDKVLHDPMPCMGAEDFAYMLEARPGAYIWMGQGQTDASGAIRPDEPMLHDSAYDFNDTLLPLGASYWVKLVQTVLGKDATL